MKKTLETIFLSVITCGLVYAGTLSLNSMLISPLSEWLKTQDFVEVPAKLSEFKMKLSNDDRNIHIVATYSYLYLGQSFQSNRVTLDDTPDADPDYYSEIFDQLLIQHNNNNLQAYINPGTPNDSILSKRLKKSGLAFGWLFFSFAWMVAFYMALWIKNRLDTSKSARVIEPGIPSSERSGPFILRLVAKIFLRTGIILFPSLSFLAFDENRSLIQSLIIVLLSFIFPVMGWLVYKYFQREKIKFDEIGNTRLILKPEKGMNEGDIAGYFDVKAEPIGELVFTLSCTHYLERPRRSGQSHSESDPTGLLSVQQVAYSKLQSGRGYRLIFLFNGFKKLPASGDVNDKEGILWALECAGKVRALKTGREVDLKRSWKIPVIEGNTESIVRRWYKSQPEISILEDSVS